MNQEKPLDQEKPSRKIEARKRGNALGFWFFKAFLHLFGLHGAYGLLYVVCLYYLIFDKSAVCASRAYIQRKFPDDCGFFKKHLHTYRLFISQGKQLIDLSAILTKEKEFDIRLQGYGDFASLVCGSRQGVILLTAHVGNWQLAMTALGELKKEVYLLMRPEDNQAVKNFLQIGRESGHLKIISPEQDLGGVVKVIDVLKQGHIVSIMGDRSYGSRALEVSFLKESAWFPYGAFSIAAAVECPIVVLLSMKTADNKYVIDVSNVLYPRYEGGQSKPLQLQAWVQHYAALLETYVNRYPYQCFLFHDIWSKRCDSIDPGVTTLKV